MSNKTYFKKIGKNTDYCIIKNKSPSKESYIDNQKLLMRIHLFFEDNQKKLYYN